MAANSGPAPALGHLRLDVRDVGAAKQFLESIGLIVFREHDHGTIMELKDGTHLALHASDADIPDGTPAQFDVVVDDLDAAWSDYDSKGLSPSEISRGEAHDSFTVPGPAPYTVTVNSPFKGQRVD